MIAAAGLAEHLPVSGACDALGIARATFYRARRPAIPIAVRPAPRRALSNGERDAVFAVLHEPRFVDHAPVEIHSVLLDEGVFLCSPRTMYRLLAAHAEVRERRDLLSHPAYVKPVLLATRPNEVWSWDITKIQGPVKWSWFQLYVVLDIFSRYVVAWLLADCESAALARRLLSAAVERERVSRKTLTIHADRGSSMRSKCVAELLVDLDVVRSHSRPHTSNDNPFSESAFKTMKYDPEFPERFESIAHGREVLTAYFDWYNTQHRHSGIALLTPETVHRGRAADVVDRRRGVLAAAYAARPERFVNGPPRCAAPPAAVWINPPRPEPALVVAGAH